MTAVPTCFFVSDGKDYVPTRLARGPWGPSISGNYVGGMLGRTVEHEVDDAGLQPARLTVDLLRPVALKPLQMHSSVVRDGRRLRLVDAVMTQDDVIVARASGLFLRRSEHTTVDTVWTSPVTMPAIPADPVMLAGDVPMVFHSFGRDPVAGSPGVGVKEWRHRGQKFRVDSGDQVARRRRATVAFHSRGHGRRCHQFANPLGHRGIAVHQRRLHGHAQSFAGRRLHRVGCGDALQPRWRRHRRRDAVRRNRTDRQRYGNGIGEPGIHATTVDIVELIGAQVMAPSIFNSIRS